MKKIKVIVIIATKNRSELLKKAILSVSSQTFAPHEIIVSSNSNILEEKQNEKELKNRFNFTFLENDGAKNYGANLNATLTYIISKKIEKKLEFQNTYIAFLDDDDFWEKEYLEKCVNKLNGKNDVDLVISNLNFINKNDKNEIFFSKLKVKKQLNYKDFLVTNPGIQGSNTFVKLNTLLEAGAFDENLSSTTDRDLFTRIFLLKPKIKFINDFLVNINTSHSKSRLTKDVKNKRDSFSKFFVKYGGLMNDNETKSFLERAKKFKVHLTVKNIQQKFKIRSRNTNNNDKFSSLKEKSDDENTIIFSFVSTSEKNLRKFIQNIIDFNYKNTKIVALANFENNNGYDHLYNDYKNIDLKLITLPEAKHFIKHNLKLNILKSQIKNNKNLNTIALARTTLQFMLYELIQKNEIAWILDDDMDFYEINFDGTKKIKKQVQIDKVISKYKDKCDALIGGYSNQPPLPFLSTLRTNLLDFVYFKYLNKNDIYDNKIYYKKDYYYDLTDEKNKTHWETPLRVDFDKTKTLDDIFAKKAQTRFLFNNSEKQIITKNRGGNTLIFNKNILKIPNISFLYNKKFARRSDFFWTILAKKEKFKIVSSTFTTFHENNFFKFNYADEIEKIIDDFIGYSFTKIYEHNGYVTIDEFNELFKLNFLKKSTNFVLCYFRIIGLLKIANDQKYSNFFNFKNLLKLIERFRKIIDEKNIKSNYTFWNFAFSKKLLLQNEDSLKNKIKKVFKIKNIKKLGSGNEAVVFHDDKWVYKIFYKLKNLDILNKVNESLKNLKKENQLIKVDVIKDKTNSIIKYPFEPKFQIYKSGYVLEIINLIKFLKKNNLEITNFKKENFIVVNDKLKWIDYGESFLHYDEEHFNKSMKIVYKMLKYPTNSQNFWKIIVLSHFCNKYQLIDYSNYGIEIFYRLFNDLRKEDIHDTLVKKIIEKHKPKNAFDYGAGKCRIANSLNEKIKFSAYDPDQKTIEANAKNNIEIYKDVNDIKKTFELINSNLVLCFVDDLEAKNIVQKINNLLEINGKAIISICNPFYNYVNKTETRLNGTQEYSKSHNFYKKTIFSTINEHHRNIKFYEALFEKWNFKINNVWETSGVNTESLNLIGEHLIFECTKVDKINAISKFEIELKDNLIFLNWKNSSPERIKKFFDSLKNQKNQNFTVLLFLNNCNERIKDYINFLIKYDVYLKEKIWIYKKDNLQEKRIYNEILNNKNFNKIIYINNNGAFYNEDSLDKIINSSNDFEYINVLRASIPWDFENILNIYKLKCFKVIKQKLYEYSNNFSLEEFIKNNIKKYSKKFIQNKDIMFYIDDLKEKIGVN
ncbi:glycosyltransferase family 2 protein [Mesomycoplasma neurolyticum]|uniref:Glycosyl transferase family 2 n=1 Tax=Mesomycoplasma neurolyticum TaxID=2120 RepID=A0A449A5R8_9BACT|nr:glycosyltransferase [Mesomycoplasma neurolyticum]VEU59630.1 Glycosyl transferase family 2 [Mesomycoplasma neurolyticum]